MIDPNNITTVRVGELPPSDFSLTDNIPHEVGADLRRGTVQQFADFIASVIETGTGLAFNPTTVPDGGTLPVTISNEWILVGKGTFHNVGGGSDIVTTEELNALTSNGTFWSLSVEIPINVEFVGITQNIRSGYTTTTPSEDKLFNRFAEVVAMFANYTPNGGYTGTAADIVNSNFPIGVEFTAEGGETSFDIETTALAKLLFWNGVPQAKEWWNQTGTTITLNFTDPLNAGDFIQMI